VLQNDVGLPPTRQLELSHSLTDRIIKRTQSPTPFPPQPRAPTPTHRTDTKSTTAQYLIGVLGQIWAIDPDGESNSTPGVAYQYANGSTSSAFSNRTLNEETSIKNLVPSHQQAVIWMSYFHAGPNKLFRICSPTESLRLLESFYHSEQAICPMNECLITWQLACGALFHPNTNASTSQSLYKSAQMQTVVCIEREQTTLLWIVPTLLLECLYLMNPKPRNCWVILGK
jgi:hypothetical protein